MIIIIIKGYMIPTLIGLGDRALVLNSNNIWYMLRQRKSNVVQQLLTVASN